jgi:hypothetical protein
MRTRPRQRVSVMDHACTIARFHVRRPVISGVRSSAPHRDAESEQRMLSSLLKHHATATVGDEFVIAPHHTDRLRRPAARLDAIDRDRFQQALTWNVFRTLELIAPAFWIRKLHLRLIGDASPEAPQTVRISLWHPLPLPPIQRIDGASPDAVADVVIETEHTVWTLMAPTAGYDGDDSKVAQAADAGAWLAGAREHYCGIIDTQTTSTSFGGVVKRRYARSRESVTLRSATRGPAAPALTRLGTIEWSDLVSILNECQEAQSLTRIERALARNAVEWLRRVRDGSVIK